MLVFTRVRRMALAAACGALLVACGGGGGGGGGSESGSAGAAGSGTRDYFPLGLGDRWIYADDAGGRSTVEVTGTQVIAQGTAMVVQTVDNTGSSTELYLRSTVGVLLIPNPGDDPLTAAIGSLQILRFPVTPGDHWVLFDKTLSAVADIDGDGRPENIAVRVEATVIGFETVSTPAGTYTQAAHVQTVLTQAVTLTSNGQPVTATVTSDDWYAPDIGPVHNVVVAPAAGGTDRVTTSVTGWHVSTRRSESTPPAVLSKTPDAGSTQGGCCAALSVQFDEPMDHTGNDASGLHLTGPDGHDVPGQVVWQSATSASFAPTSPLVSGTYTAHVSTAAKDLVGNALAAALDWQFTVDATAPGVLPMQPLPGAVEVPLTSQIVFALDDDVDPATLARLGITLSDGSAFVDVDITISGRTYTVTPRAPLKTAATYTVFVSNIADRYGNHADHSWTFTADPGRFAAPVSLIGSAPVTATAVGDVNGDGLADVVVATGYYAGLPDEFGLFVFRRQPDGSFAAPQRFATHASYGAEIHSLTVVDLDGRGRNAIVAGTDRAGIEIFRWPADGSPASSLWLPTQASYVVRVIDMNGDGRLDLVGCPFLGDAVQVWYQAVDGSFGTPVAVPVAVGGYGDMAVGDISGDGRLDIVVTSGQGVSGQEIAILRQRPDGGFDNPAFTRAPAAFGAQGVAIGDVNGDGRADVVVALPGSSAIGLLTQDAQGNLAGLAEVATTSSISTLALADFDGDGRLDVAAAASGGFPLALHRQRADGSLASAENFALNAYGGPWQGLLSVGDVNGDGLPDVVYGDKWSRQRLVPPSAPPAASPTLVGATATRLGMRNALPLTGKRSARPGLSHFDKAKRVAADLRLVVAH